MYRDDIQIVSQAIDKFSLIQNINEFTDSPHHRISNKKLITTIESIATGTPDSIVHQSAAAKVVANLPNLIKHQGKIRKIYQNTQINTRHLALNLLSDEAIFFSRSASIQARTELYRQHAIPLAEQVANKAINLANAKLNDDRYSGQFLSIKDSIGLIVFVSSTGFLAPGVDVAVIERLGLRRDIARINVNFMGCAAAMNGLQIASDRVRANPQQRALVICLELSSINAVFEDDINDLIIHSIFGDGCAAILVGACELDSIVKGQIVIRDRFSNLLANTEDGIILGIQDYGITCKLSRQLPDYIEAGVGATIERFLINHGLTIDRINSWAIHPGGRKIIESAQRSLGLDDSQVVDSWKILAKYGNMLSPSVLFVMEQILLKWETVSHHQPLTGVAFSFSPGVGIEGILFEQF